ncbi:MAG TPA: hypothetical protein VF128_12925 [Gemmatimonadaceae bacterium]
MKTRLVAAAITILTASACASSQLPTDPVVYSQSEAADSVKVRVGQTIVVGGIRVRFSNVESDSRCASDVVCVWEGDAVANFVVEQNCACESPAFELKLHTTLEPKSGSAYGSRIELLELAPYPRTTSPVRKDSYEAWVRITSVQ